MNLNIKGIKSYSAQRLAQNREPLLRNLLIYALALAGAQAFSLLASRLLISQADKMTGLSATGIRTILLSAQQVLSLLVTVLAPLWQVGYLLSCLDVSRGNAPEPKRLTYGIRHSFKYLFCYLLMALRIMLLIYLTILLGSIILSFVLSSTINLDPALISSQDPAALQAAYDAIMAAVQPMLIPGMAVIFLLCAVVVIPVLYRYRLVVFLAADHPELGAGQVLRLSSFLMKGVRLQYLKLDLSYWWFYLLLGLSEVIAVTVPTLELLEFPLPMDADLLLLLTQLISLGALALVSVLFYNRIQVTYASAYDHLSQARLQSSQA